MVGVVRWSAHLYVTSKGEAVCRLEMRGGEHPASGAGGGAGESEIVLRCTALSATCTYFATVLSPVVRSLLISEFQPSAAFCVRRSLVVGQTFVSQKLFF